VQESSLSRICNVSVLLHLQIMYIAASEVRLVALAKVHIVSKASQLHQSSIHHLVSFFAEVEGKCVDRLPRVRSSAFV
jgi:hypothetical protein